MKEHKEGIIVFSSYFGGLALVSLGLFLTQKQAFGPHALAYLLAFAGVMVLAAGFKWGPRLWKWNSASSGISRAVSKSISDDPATRMAGINQLISIADMFGGKYRAHVVDLLCAKPNKITVDAFFERPEGGDFDQEQLAKQRGLAQEQSRVIEALRVRFRPQSPALTAGTSSGSATAADPSMRDWRDCALSFNSFGVPSHFLVPFNFDHCEVNGKADFKNAILLLVAISRARRSARPCVLPAPVLTGPCGLTVCGLKAASTLLASTSPSHRASWARPVRAEHRCSRNGTVPAKAPRADVRNALLVEPLL